MVTEEKLQQCESLLEQCSVSNKWREIRKIVPELIAEVRRLKATDIPNLGMFKEGDYKRVHLTEASGSHYAIGIKVLVAGVKLSADENANVSDYVQQMKKSILLSQEKNSEEGKARRAKTVAELTGLFGDRAIYVEEIENQYNDSWTHVNSPWLIVTTKKGRIKLGWRSHVISIDWHDSQVTEWADELFPQENVTKDRRMIHAWGLEKAKQYIDMVLSDPTISVVESV